MKNELKLSYMFMPVAVVSALSYVSIPLSLIFAFIVTLVVTSKSVYYSVPLVLFGSGFQLIGIYSGVHYGWFIVLSALLGATYQIFTRGVLRIYMPFGILVLLVLTLSFMHLLADSLYLERYFGLISVLVYSLFLLGFSEDHAPQDLENNLLSAIAFAGLCMGAAVFLLFTSQELSLARTSEMSFAVGDTQSSPRLLTTVLGSVLTLTMLSLIIEKNGILSKVLYLVSSLCVLLAMVYAGSRMPLIATVVSITIGLFIYLVRNFSKLPARFVVWVSVLVLVFSSLIFYFSMFGVAGLPFVPDSVESLRVLKAVNIDNNGRLLMWSSYLDGMDVLDMLFGIGLGTFGNPHSFWIGGFIAFGVIGIFPIILFLMVKIFQSFCIGAIYPLATLIYILLSVSTSSDIDRMQPWIILSLACLLYVTTLNGWKENGKTE
ncbi:hypothetical protein MKP05_20315 [Halomonas sp. EGI 63088]|uniref:O-antigen ligase like membrane protein n=1 Tax=Halomonas flagellata TaxID=2920385 RepID=A0ABS9S020_9GAMM|nr:hypothetical protein [Halomonas flagellata]MCH4565446.1 hypothetical protein [Halomonas flagellata]